MRLQMKYLFGKQVGSTYIEGLVDAESEELPFFNYHKVTICDRICENVHSSHKTKS